MKRGWGVRSGAVVVVMALGMSVAPSAQAVDPPSLRLFAVKDSVTVRRYGGTRVFVQPGTWLTPVGGAFELWASRPDYGSPVELRQVDAETGSPLQSLPADLLRGWLGLKRFLVVRARDSERRLVYEESFSLCLNGWQRERIDDSGPTTSRYPFGCGGFALTKGMVWGIDQGWAISPFGFDGDSLVMRVPDGEYRLNIHIAPNYVDLLGIAPGEGRVVIDLTVKTADRPGGEPRRSTGGSEASEVEAEKEEAAASASVPDVFDPDPGTVPDLRPLPSWGISLDDRGGREILTFNATEWNMGPAPLVVEGFRRQGEDVMDAYQYFYENGEPVGRSSAGELHYHQGGGHSHWHFDQFARYQLLDDSRTKVRQSGKQAWCLVPTDAIDLTVEGANWTPDDIGLGSACGGSGSLWVREILDVGWGDTYSQYVSGQAFDVTNLPNGRYYIKVEVNPQGVLHEANASNNVTLRRISIRGREGNRVVRVPLWHGIETEGGYYGWSEGPVVE
jgi:hypothetical protein